jgi:hypothetical protein
MKSKCLKIYLKNRKLFIHVTGMDLTDLQERIGLVYEIVKAIGKSQGLKDLMEPGDIHDVGVVTDDPDYFVILKEGRINIINPI